MLLVLAVVLLGSAIRNIKEDGDFRGYIEVGELVLRGADIYADARPDVNTWPPLYAVVCVPFALLARVERLSRARRLARAQLRLHRRAASASRSTLVYRRPLALAPATGRRSRSPRARCSARWC